MEKKDKIMLVVSSLLLAGFFALFLTGLGSEGIRTVLDKATAICLECIGIG